MLVQFVTEIPDFCIRFTGSVLILTSNQFNRLLMCNITRSFFLREGMEGEVGLEHKVNFLQGES